MNAHQGVGVDIDVCVNGSSARPPRRQRSQGGDLNVGVGGEKTLVPVYSCESGRVKEEEGKRERESVTINVSTLKYIRYTQRYTALHNLTHSYKALHSCNTELHVYNPTSSNNLLKSHL